MVRLLTLQGAIFSGVVAFLLEFYMSYLVDHQQADGSNNECPWRIIVNYIPNVLSDIDFARPFYPMGNILQFNVAYDKNNVQLDGKNRIINRGFGFVTYESPEDAEKAIKILDGLQLDGKEIKVSYARRSSADIQNTNLFLKHLPKQWELEDLNDFFGQYGSIITSKLLKNKDTGRNSGCGFVRFSLQQEAQLAIAEADGFRPEGSETELDVKLAKDPKGVPSAMASNASYNAASLGANTYM